MGSFPNTYTFSKLLAEQIINDESANMPMVIFRPSIGKYINFIQYRYNYINTKSIFQLGFI